MVEQGLGISIMPELLLKNRHDRLAVLPLVPESRRTIGIAVAAQKSEEQGIAKPGLAAKIKADLEYCGLPTALPCPEEDLKEALENDKKASEGKLNFVFIKDIGSVTVKKI